MWTRVVYDIFVMVQALSFGEESGLVVALCFAKQQSHFNIFMLLIAIKVFILYLTTLAWLVIKFRQHSLIWEELEHVLLLDHSPLYHVYHKLISLPFPHTKLRCHMMFEFFKFHPYLTKRLENFFKFIHTITRLLIILKVTIIIN